MDTCTPVLPKQDDQNEREKLSPAFSISSKVCDLSLKTAVKLLQQDL